jgi:signal transduction histidine kinase/DNA-binding LacI/PurR family transcriptional regulator/ActR/RegA family two-component response regulator
VSATGAAHGRPERLRIAVLLDHLNLFSGGFEARLRDAFHARCRNQGHHLLLLYGGLLEPPQPMSIADNALYELLRPDSVDGIIVVSSLLSAYSGPEGIGRLVDRYKPARLCSIGVQLPGVASIVLDNAPGMEAVVEHLVQHHGCRHLAFLEGTPKNPEADVRLRSYQVVLERHGIPFDPARVARGYFRTNLAKVAMEEILARGVKIDGVVAANDEMAAGAIEVLRKHGRRVPLDVPVTGFDDIPLARLANPPLSTVGQPFDLVVDLAVRSLRDQLAGKEVLPCTQVGAEFIRRQSCGCGHGTYCRDSASVGPRNADTLVERIEALGPRLAEMLRTGWSDGLAAALQLLDGMQQEVAGRGGSFSHAVAELVESVGDDSERHQLVQSAIGYLRAQLRDLAPPEIERCFYDALNLVALSNTTTQFQHRLQLDENYLRLLSVGERASFALDLSSLRDALVEGLPNAGVRTVFLSCVSDAGAAELVPTVCLLDGKPFDTSAAAFPAHCLLPPEVFALDRRETFLVFPLVFDAQLLGVIAFSYSEGTNAYAAFRNEIATALMSVRLRQKLIDETTLRERSVQERLSTSKRMEALSVLAGGVAHDLNNALGPLIVIPDMILAQLDESPSDEASLREFRSDIQIIKAASLRAAQTIKDLLTLGRQGRMLKEDLDLNQVVRSCLAESSVRFAREGATQVRVSADIVPSLLMVRGAESQLARAIGNLIRNAVEAVAADGQVVVKTSQEDPIAPIAAYETIPPGKYAVLTVSDNGCGIAPAELGRIFEPFFTKKRARENSGSGLGLAIVHGVVKEHEGFIDVNSTLEAGTTIALYLPRIVDRTAERERTREIPHGSSRILIIDDEPIQLRTGRRVLAKLGYQVEALDSGARACELFERAATSGKSPFDLIIVDMVLGEALDGLQVFEQIERLFPAQRVILMSGHAPSERAQLAVRKGLPWLAKPYTLESLAQAVQQVLHAEPETL